MESPRYSYEFKDGTMKENLTFEEAYRYEIEENPRTVTLPGAYDDPKLQSCIISYDQICSMEKIFDRGFLAGLGIGSAIVGIGWIITHFLT